MLFYVGGQVYNIQQKRAPDTALPAFNSFEVSCARLFAAQWGFIGLRAPWVMLAVM
jgi:hypothetical protein